MAIPPVSHHSVFFFTEIVDPEHPSKLSWITDRGFAPLRWLGNGQKITYRYIDTNTSPERFVAPSYPEKKGSLCHKFRVWIITLVAIPCSIIGLLLFSIFKLFAYYYWDPSAYQRHKDIRSFLTPINAEIGTKNVIVSQEMLTDKVGRKMDKIAGRSIHSFTIHTGKYVQISRLGVGALNTKRIIIIGGILSAEFGKNLPPEWRIKNVVSREAALEQELDRSFTQTYPTIFLVPAPSVPAHTNGTC